MWLSASTKLPVAACAIVPRAAAGACARTALICPLVTAAATWSARLAAGVLASALVMPSVTWWAKIEPSAAMPVAMPTWRKVEFTPEAMPARSGRTTPTAVEASGTLISPMPRPATISPGIRCVHSESTVMPRISHSPSAATKKPGAISHLVGTWLVSRPATIAATNDMPERNRKRTPASTAE